MISIMRTPHSGLGKSLTMVGYTSVLPKIDESRLPLSVFNANNPVPQKSVS